MWHECDPDSVETVVVNQYRVVTYSFGTSENVLLCLNGGPGLPCDYLRDAHSWLRDKGYRVVTFDQLGTGASDRPDDPSLWTIARYVEEVETVRRMLNLGRVHLLGHSWGGWLAIDYALTYPQNLHSLILADTVADMPHLVQELNRLRAALGSETVSMMQKHEAEGSLDHPEYVAAITILNHRHVCRLPEWPAPVTRSLNDWNMGPYVTMQGPNEFLYTGNLKDWSRIQDLPALDLPVLIVHGEHDELTPACGLRMKTAIAGAEMLVVRNASHMPFYENPEAYFPPLLDFLSRASAQI